MTFKKLLRVMEILTPHLSEGMNTMIGGADHDVVMLSYEPDPEILSQEEKTELDELGVGFDDERRWHFYA